jgi:hypothetical protein
VSIFSNQIVGFERLAQQAGSCRTDMRAAAGAYDVARDWSESTNRVDSFGTRSMVGGKKPPHEDVNSPAQMAYIQQAVNEAAKDAVDQYIANVNGGKDRDPVVSRLKH